MPELDLSDAVTNTDFVDGTLVVYRRSETIDESTGFSDLHITTFKDVYATVCAGDQNALEPGSDESHQNKSISIVTRFALRGVAPGMQPDIVLWRGDRFKVVEVGDYSHFAAGFIQAIAHSIDAADIGPETLPTNMGEMIFVAMPNSGLLAIL